MTKLFKVESNSTKLGSNWIVARFGTDRNGKDYYIVTNNVHASNLNRISGGAKIDAELVCKLLNEYFKNL